MFQVHQLSCGNASCTILRLPGNATFLFDCGANINAIIRYLARLKVHRIAGIVLSHNDLDHIRSFEGILTSYRYRIGKVYIVGDLKCVRPEVLDPIVKEYRAGYLSQDRIQAAIIADKPRVLFSQHGVSVRLLAPCQMAVMIGMRQRDPNTSSTILSVDYAGKYRYIYASDATTHSLEFVKRANGNKPIRCDVLTVPHHGALISSDNADGITSYFQPEYSLISVGSGNTYGHPHPGTITALKGSSCVICTQMTSACAQDRSALVGVREVAGLPVNTGGRSHDCMGNIVVTIGETVSIRNLEEHQQYLGMLRTDQRLKAAPLCKA